MIVVPPPGLMKRKGAAIPVGSTEFPATSDQFQVIKLLSRDSADLNNLAIAEDLTIEFWFKALQNYSGFQYLLEKGDLGDPNFIVNYTPTSITFQSETTGGSSFTLTRNWGDFPSAVLNNWVHIAVTRIKATGVMQFYRNGAPFGASATAQAGANMHSAGAGHHLVVGCREHNGNFSCGARMAELRLWSVARTAGEIAANYLSSLNGVGTGLQLDCPLAVDWLDRTANANHLALKTLGTPTGEPTLVGDGPGIS